MARNSQTLVQHSGRTFVVAMWVLGVIVSVEFIAIAYSLITRVDFSPPPEHRSSSSTQSRGSSGDLITDAELLKQEAALLDSLPGGSERRMEPTPAPRTPTQPPPSSRTGYIADVAVAELVAVGKALRGEGDMKGALDKLRQANERLPGNPQILYELASAYQTMGLDDKASTYWQQVWELGPEVSGHFYDIADLKLRGGAEEPTRSQAVLTVGQAFIKRHPEVADGEQVTIRIELKARPGAELDVSKVYMEPRFYELVNGKNIEPTTTPVEPKDNWITKPIDWKDQPEEIVDVVWFYPTMTESQIRNFGKREYYGIVVTLYYDDELQDIFMAPKTLMEELRRGKQTGTYSPLEASLFPEE